METPELLGRGLPSAPFASAACVPARRAVSTVISITQPGRIVTKSVSRSDILRKLTTACVISIAAVSAGAHPLEDAAATAVVACAAAGSKSIDECGNLGGRSAEASAARKAVGRFFEALNQFYRACDGKAVRACHIEAEWLSYAGVTRALDAAAPASPRSDTTR